MSEEMGTTTALESSQVNQPMVMPPEVSANARVWAARITECWRSSVEGIIRTGCLLLEAKAVLVHGEFGAMCSRELPFSESTAQRLMAIARDPRISNPAHVQLLPASWGTLYELTKLTDEEFESAVAQHVISPDMLRADAELIRPLARPLHAGGVEQSTRDNLDGPTLQSQSGEIPDPGTTLPNGARAIMASREHPSDDLDFFPTPPWATRALVERVFPQLGIDTNLLGMVWEPACGEGHIAEVLKEYAGVVQSTDVFDYGYQDQLHDFLSDADALRYDWIITNPPFEEKSELFVLRALERARRGVAMFVRLQWLETVGRYERIFRDRPPTLIAFFAERVNLCKGRWEPDGTTATAYIWLVWVKDELPRAPFWIPPGCREELTHLDDAMRFTAHPVIRREEVSEAAA